jgi:hypothetical protein
LESVSAEIKMSHAVQRTEKFRREGPYVVVGEIKAAELGQPTETVGMELHGHGGPVRVVRAERQVAEFPQRRQHRRRHVPDLTVLDAKVAKLPELAQETSAVVFVLQGTLEEENVAAFQSQSRYPIHLTGGQVAK